MSNSIKNTLVVIISILAGGLFVFLAESLIHQWYPLPTNVDPDDMKSIKQYMPNAPVGSLALMVLTHAIAAFISGWLIAKFAKSNVQFLALITGMIWTLVGVTNIVMIPHPIWFSIADTCIYLPMTILGTKALKF